MNRWRWSWGIRISAPGTPAPGVPSPPAITGSSSRRPPARPGPSSWPWPRNGWPARWSVWSVKNGVVSDRDRPTVRVTYGELTAGRIIERHLAELPPLKPASAYTTSGRPFLRRDAIDKVLGKARFAGDIRLPGMLYARILRPPAHGAKLRRVDTAAAEAMKEIRVIRDGDLIAVLHPHMDGAARALSRIQADWDLPKTGIDDRTIFDHLLANAPAPVIAAEAGQPCRGRSPRQDHPGGDLPQQLRGPCAHGDPHGPGQYGRRQNHGLGLDPVPLPAPGPGGPGPGHGPGQGPHHHPLCGRGVRRQVGLGPGGGGGPAGQNFRKAGHGRLDPGGGVLLRHLPARCGGQDPLRARRRRAA